MGATHLLEVAHMSNLMKQIALKQFEVDTQCGYVALVDEMVTTSALTLPNASSSPLVKQLRSASTSGHQTLEKMVCSIIISTAYNCLHSLSVQ